MSDNTQLNAGSGGDTIASDDIAGVKYQRVKLSCGADGSATDVTVGGGVEATALRVTLASDSTGVLSVDDNGGSLTVDNGGTFAVQLTGDGLTSLQTLDNVVAVDDAAFTAAAGSGIPMMGFATSDQVNSGDVGVVRMTTYRDVCVNVRDSSGNTIDPQTDDAAFTAGTGLVSVIAAFATTDSVDSGDAGAVGMTTDRAIFANARPSTAGGLSIFRSIDLDESEEEIKATAGQVYSIAAFNTNASARYLKLYNATAANVTVGTTTPVLTYYLPATGGFTLDIPCGYAFSTAITAAATTGVADSDTGAPGANEVIVNIGYK